MTPTVRVDDEVYEELKAHAEPFVDTPNTVLRRLLGLDASVIEAVEEGPDTEEVATASWAERSQSPSVPPKKVARQRPRRKRIAKATAKRTRAPAGALLPEEDYVMPLLSALDEFGGSAPSRQVIDRVGEILEREFSDLDKESLSSGGIRWQSRVQFVRLRLVQQGLMVKETGRGIWAISDTGRALLEQTEQKAVGQ